MPRTATKQSQSKFSAWTTEHLKRIPVVEKILFVHNLQIMIGAGLSLVDALKVLAKQVGSAKLRATIVAVQVQVEQGQQFSEALAHFPKLFPPMYVSMIAAGETAGKLEGALTQVSTQMKKSHEMLSKIHGALIYPAVIMSAMVGIAIEMFVFVLPKIIVLFKDFGARLPLSTRVLVALVTFVENYGLYVLFTVIALIFLLTWLYRKPAVKRLVHALNLHLPIAGPIIKKINLATFSLTLSSLLSSTIPIIEAVKIAASVQSNIIYREHLLTMAEQLKRGEPLSESLEKFPHIFPPMVVQMIMVGEQSGQVEHMLQELSDYYSAEVDTTMRNFSTIIEPVIIVVLGLAVAGLAVAVIMPIYSLAESF